MWVNNKVNPKTHPAVLELPANPQEDNLRERRRESYQPGRKNYSMKNCVPGNYATTFTEFSLYI